MQSTLFGVVKFQTAQVCNSWNDLFVVTSKSQLLSILHITLLLGEVTFLTLRSIRIATCQRSLPLISWTQITYQSWLAFWTLLRARECLDPVEKFTDCERFQSLASGLISPSIQIHSSEEADKASRVFAASVASADRLSTRKTTILDRIYEAPSLGCLLKHKKQLTKLWQETSYPACKMAVNLVTKSVRRMTRKRSLEGWETKIANSTSSNMAYLRNPSQKGVDQRHHSWSLRSHILSYRQSQRNCRKPLHTMTCVTVTINDR
jgi:hypothetical protein